MKIGELARATNTPVATIRYYEREDLLPQPARTEGNYRIYDAGHVQRLSFIRHCRGLDMSLDEIRVLLRFLDTPSENCAEVNALLDEHVGHVARRIAELRQLERQLRELRRRCLQAQDAAHCGILTGLSEDARLDPAEAPDSRAHVHGTHHGAHRGVAGTHAAAATRTAPARAARRSRAR